jgi:hypothetical protein
MAREDGPSEGGALLKEEAEGRVLKRPAGKSHEGRFFTSVGQHCSDRALTETDEETQSKWVRSLE